MENKTMEEKRPTSHLVTLAVMSLGLLALIAFAATELWNKVIISVIDLNEIPFKFTIVVLFGMSIFTSINKKRWTEGKTTTEAATMLIGRAVHVLMVIGLIYWLY